MRKEFLISIIWVKFGYNYSNPDDFINYICEKVGRPWLKDHLREKFDDIYDRYGSHAVMNAFLCELDEELQQALVEYAMNVYAPNGMGTKYEEYKSL